MRNEKDGWASIHSVDKEHTEEGSTLMEMREVKKDESQKKEMEARNEEEQEQEKKCETS